MFKEVTARLNEAVAKTQNDSLIKTIKDQLDGYKKDLAPLEPIRTPVDPGAADLVGI